MFRGAFIFFCGLAAGVMIYDTALERATVKAPHSTMPQFWVRYSTPVMTDYSKVEVERMYKDTLKARK